MTYLPEIVGGLLGAFALGFVLRRPILERFYAYRQQQFINGVLKSAETMISEKRLALPLRIETRGIGLLEVRDDADYLFLELALEESDEGDEIYTEEMRKFVGGMIKTIHQRASRSLKPI